MEDFDSWPSILDESVYVSVDFLDFKILKRMFRPSPNVDGSHMVFDSAQRYTMVEIKLHHLSQCDMGSEQVSVFQLAGPVQENGT